MIDPKELRLGNYILSRETREPQTVTAIGEDYICFDAITCDYPTPHEIDPLPLTNEYLDLFGAIRVFGYPTQYLFKKRGVIVTKRNDGFYEYETDTKLDYVHELQNLFFALTKTELI